MRKDWYIGEGRKAVETFEVTLDDFYNRFVDIIQVSE